MIYLFYLIEAFRRTGLERGSKDVPIQTLAVTYQQLAPAISRMLEREADYIVVSPIDEAVFQQFYQERSRARKAADQ